MKYTGKIWYPDWVNQKYLILGDIQYRRKDDNSEWSKMIYNGNKWIPYNIAMPQLRKKSDLRHSQMNHNKMTRESGVR